MHKPKVVLVVMDGWGYSPIHKGNAIWSAKTPNFDYLWNNYSHLLLNSFGENVGLPWGAIGSSEVGHTSLGSGKLVHQELALIDKEVESGDFFNNKELNKSIDTAEKSGGNLHLIGLVSDGGVHSHMSHIFAILKLLKHRKFPGEILIHAITDGRDTSPNSAVQYLNELSKEIKRLKIKTRIATVCGRYFAMDRDNHWDRTKKAFDAFTEGIGDQFDNYTDAIKKSYANNVSDEFISPIVINSKNKEDSGIFSKIFKSETPKHHLEKNERMVSDKDGIIFFNIRPDRMRQITEMFLFERSDVKTEPVKTKNVLTITTYNEYLPVSVAYPSIKIDNPLAKILSDNGFSQGHFAETEKYAHVTYFFNGGNATPFPKEIWELVPSPNVKTYDLEPEMSAAGITKKIFDILKKKPLDFILINYANADMVGHTGSFNAVVKGVETVDEQLGKLMELLPETTLIVTADHGNAECMVHPETGEIDKKHTVNPVPFIFCNEEFKKKADPNENILASGILADVAPTILSLLKIKAPSDMNGVDLTHSLK